MGFKNKRNEFVLLFLIITSIYIHAGTIRNITSIDLEYKSNGVWVITVDDTFILGLTNTLSFLIKPVTRFYPQLVTGDVESGLIYLWAKGVYSQFSITMGFPLAPFISEWRQTRHNFYADFTIERQKFLFTTGLKASLMANDYWVSYFIGYSHRFGILELWIRNNLTYGYLTLWMDSLWGESRWYLNEQWILKGGATAGTYKPEESSLLSGVEFSIYTGFTMQLALIKWGYQFTYTRTPDYSSQKHLLVLDIQL